MTRLGLEKTAIKFLEQNLGLREKEKLLVVSDRKKDPLFNAVCRAAKSLKAELKTSHITRHRAHSQPLPGLKDLFSSSNIIIGITDKSITHCPETRLARKRHGTRVITMVETDEKLFLKGMKADQKQIKRISEKLVEKLRKTRQVRIISPSGTDLKVNVIKASIDADTGDSTKPGSLNNFPYGEAMMSPVNIADGILAIDFSRANIKPRDKVKLILKKGRIICFNNEKARQFRDYLWGIDKEKALRIVELGFGTNPMHKKLIGNIIHDEKIIGSAHVAFGGFGNKRKCKIHEDVIMLKPTVFFDKKKIIEKGKIK